MVSDPVGYGFVIRGSRPVYIHTIDPSGPAAGAGLRVSNISGLAHILLKKQKKNWEPHVRIINHHLLILVCMFRSETIFIL